MLPSRGSNGRGLAYTPTCTDRQANPSNQLCQPCQRTCLLQHLEKETFVCTGIFYKLLISNALHSPHSNAIVLLVFLQNILGILS